MRRMCWRTRLLGLYLFSLFLSHQIRGAQVNVTIDDQFADPMTGQLIQYNPREAWQTGQDCEPCTAKPRPIRNANRGTWMDATFFPEGSDGNSVAGQLVTATVPFIGTAVYVQAILTGSVQFPNGNSDMNFLIDDSTVGSFIRAPNGDPSFQFNQTVFSTTGLANSLHTLTIELGRSGNRSLLLLDAIIYTTDVPDATESSDTSLETDTSDSDSNNNVAVIVGPVVGGLIVAAALIALLFFLRRRRQGQRVRVLLDSPPMDFIDAAPGGSIGQRRDTLPVRVDPYNPAISHMAYSHTDVGRTDASSMRGTFSPGNFPSEYQHGPIGASQYHGSPPSQGSGSSGSRVDESVVNVNAPLSPSYQFPPAYTEISESTSFNVQSVHPYRKGGLTVQS